MRIMFVALFLTALFLESEGKNTLFGHDMYYAVDFLVLRIFEKLVQVIFTWNLRKSASSEFKQLSQWQSW